MQQQTRLVPVTADRQAYSDAIGVRQIKSQREELLAEAVKYVNLGKDGHRCDRLRTASNLSGLPYNLIDVEAGR